MLSTEAESVANNLAWALRCCRAGQPFHVPIMHASHGVAGIAEDDVRTRARVLVDAAEIVYADRDAEWRTALHALSSLQDVESKDPSLSKLAYAVFGGGWLHVIFRTRALNVQVPARLLDEGMARLLFGFDTPIPMPDLAVNLDGISATLSFGGRPFPVFVPWESVTTMSRDGEAWKSWPPGHDMATHREPVPSLATATISYAARPSRDKSALAREQYADKPVEDVARERLQWLYLSSVDREALSAFDALRDTVRGLARGEAVEIDRDDLVWEMAPSTSGVVVAASRPPRKQWAPRFNEHGECTNRLPFIWSSNMTGDALTGNPDYSPQPEEPDDAPMWPDARLALSAVIEWLPEQHALLPRLMLADDGLSDWTAVYRWARALGWWWGVDGEAYALHVSRHRGVA